jgi:hypothetical protein
VLSRVEHPWKLHRHILAPGISTIGRAVCHLDRVIEQELDMAKFITIGYGDEDGYQRTAESVRNAAHAQDARLRASGALIGVAGTPTQVRNHDDAGVQLTEGPFLRSGLPIAGFAVIEARDLQEAIALVSKSPCAVAQGVVEVWPLEEMS